jgi:2-polyprenyl-3-methyl-5-hydroxy-6-metoxy-1,4-benzoquinol methylase
MTHEHVCPLCGSPADRGFETRDHNRAVTSERFTYDRCRACGTYFLVNVPDDLGPYYGGDYFVLPSRAQLARVAARETYKLDFLRRHITGRRVVEVGPGFGVFAKLARDAGYDYTGIEMDARCCEYLRSEVGVNAIHSDAPEEVLAELPPSDAIALWHVLEHLRDPGAFLARAAGALAPGGILIVAMPNPEALQFRLLGARWTHVDAPRHLFLVPSQTLVERARQKRLEPVELTSDDPGGRGWNAFGWQHVLVRPRSSTPARVAALAAGRAFATVMAPFERRPMRGSTYTAVLQRPHETA